MSHTSCILLGGEFYFVYSAGYKSEGTSKKHRIDRFWYKFYVFNRDNTAYMLGATLVSEIHIHPVPRLIQQRWLVK